MVSGFILRNMKLHNARIIFFPKVLTYSYCGAKIALSVKSGVEK